MVVPGSIPRIILLPGKPNFLLIKPQIYKHLSIAAPYRKGLSFLLKLLVLALTVFYLYEAIYMSPGQKGEFWRYVLELLLDDNVAVLGIAVLLVALNWGLEAHKWSVLAKQLEPMPFYKALQAVLAGVTLGMITPNRVGDYAARSFLMENNHRIKALGAVFLGRMCQMHSTAVFGSLGIFYFVGIRFLTNYPYVATGTFFFIVLVNAIFTVFLYNTRLLLPLVRGVKLLRPILPALWMLQRYKSHTITRILSISALRYCVFTLQFVLLLYAVDIALPVAAAFAGASSALLVKSLLPSFSFLSDIGVRELSAIHFFGLLGQNETKVLAASLTLWVINIALPALLGLLVVLKFRILKSK